MRTVENPGGTELEYQFGGTYGVLPTGCSDHPEDRADHIVRKFAQYGVRKVATKDEEAAAEKRREEIKNPMVLRKKVKAEKVVAPKPPVETEEEKEARMFLRELRAAPPEPEPVKEPAAVKDPEPYPEPYQYRELEPEKPAVKAKRGTKAHK